MPQNTMAVGNNVYNGGSNAAQRGQQLDPSGYIQRGLQKRAMTPQGQAGLGTSQPSQQRSGLAQSQLQQGMGKEPVQLPNPNVGGLAPLNLASQLGQQGQQQPMQQAPITGQIKAFDASAPSFSPAAPGVKIPGVPSSITGSLKNPLDSDLRQQRDVAYNALNESMTQLQSMIDQLNAEYQQQTRDFGTESDMAYRDLASMFAAMGGGPGTGYGQSYQDLTRDMTNYRNDLDSAYSRAQQDALSDRTSALNRFQTTLRGVTTQQSERDAKKRAEAALKKTTKTSSKSTKKAAPKPKASTSYKIKKGDTLSAIAKKHKTTVAKLMKLNPSIKNPNKIFAGNSLKLK